jgi:hypothetical protein
MRFTAFLRAAVAVGCLAGVLASAALAAEALPVRVFVLRYKRAEEAILLIRPILSDSGSILIQSKLNALTVTDDPAKLSTIAQALAQFDAPPRGFSIAVKLVKAHADAPVGNLSGEIGGIGNRLREVFKFNDYSLVDSAILQGTEGETVSYLLGGHYRVAFQIDPAGQATTLRLSQFALSRERIVEGVKRVETPLFRTTVNVGLNQTMVIAASQEEAAKKALILILFVQETPRASAGKGISGIKAAEVRP